MGHGEVPISNYWSEVSVFFFNLDLTFYFCDTSGRFIFSKKVRKWSEGVRLYGLYSGSPSSAYHSVRVSTLKFSNILFPDRTGKTRFMSLSIAIQSTTTRQTTRRTTSQWTMA